MGGITKCTKTNKTSKLRKEGTCKKQKFINFKMDFVPKLLTPEKGCMNSPEPH